MNDSEEHARRRATTRRWLVWWLYVAVWTAGLLLPMSSEGRPRWFSLPPVVGFVLAKLLHVSAYAVLAALLERLAGRTHWRWLLVAFLSLHGFATEFLQQWVPGRTGTLRDVGLDHLGIALGLAWTWWQARALKPSGPAPAGAQTGPA